MGRKGAPRLDERQWGERRQKTLDIRRKHLDQPTLTVFIPAREPAGSLACQDDVLVSPLSRVLQTRGHLNGHADVILATTIHRESLAALVYE